MREELDTCAVKKQKQEVKTTAEIHKLFEQAIIFEDTLYGGEKWIPVELLVGLQKQLDEFMDDLAFILEGKISEKDSKEIYKLYKKLLSVFGEVQK